MFIDTRNFLKAIGDALIALEWTPDEGDAQKVFDAVAYYDSARAAEAVQQLLSFSSSMAVIVPDINRFRNTEDVDGLFSVKTLEIDILFTGRSYSPTNQTENFLGMIEQDGTWTVDADNLGLLGMVDEVIDALSGKSFQDSGPLKPVFGEPLEISQEDSSTVRKSYLLTFECEAGEAEFTLI